MSLAAATHCALLFHTAYLGTAFCRQVHAESCAYKHCPWRCPLLTLVAMPCLLHTALGSNNWHYMSSEWHMHKTHTHAHRRSKSHTHTYTHLHTRTHTQTHTQDRPASSSLTDRRVEVTIDPTSRITVVSPLRPTPPEAGSSAGRAHKLPSPSGQQRPVRDVLFLRLLAK